MTSEIRTIADIKLFFAELLSEGLNFHPDELFENYVHIDTLEPLYSDQESFVRNTLLAQAFNVCEKEGTDIYELSMDIFMKDFNAAFAPEE